MGFGMLVEVRGQQWAGCWFLLTVWVPEMELRLTGLVMGALTL